MRTPARPLVAMLGLAGLAVAGCSTAPPGSGEAKAITTATAANMANNCFTCHGPGGVSPGAMPSLHLLTADNIVSQLHAFRSGERPSTVMGRHAKAYSDAEIIALAQYIAGLNRKQGAP